MKGIEKPISYETAKFNLKTSIQFDNFFMLNFGEVDCWLKCGGGGEMREMIVRLKI